MKIVLLSMNFAPELTGIGKYSGEMADELLLTSQRVLPARLEASSYTFRHPTLEGALRAALGR